MKTSRATRHGGRLCAGAPGSTGDLGSKLVVLALVGVVASGCLDRSSVVGPEGSGGGHAEPRSSAPGQVAALLHREPRSGGFPGRLLPPGARHRRVLHRHGRHFRSHGLEAGGAVSDRVSSPAVRRAALAPERASRERWAVRLDFVGANAVRPRGEGRKPAVVSYFKGGEARRRAASRPTAASSIRDLWPGIDLVYDGHGRAAQVHVPRQTGGGSRPDPARLSGRDRGDADRRGPARDLDTRGRLTDDRPYAYQDGSGGRDEVPAAFAMAHPRPTGRMAMASRWAATTAAGRSCSIRPCSSTPATSEARATTSHRHRRGRGRQRLRRRHDQFHRSLVPREGRARPDLQRRLQRRVRGQGQGRRHATSSTSATSAARAATTARHRGGQGRQCLRDRGHRVGSEHVPGEGGTEPRLQRRRHRRLRGQGQGRRHGARLLRLHRRRGLRWRLGIAVDGAGNAYVTGFTDPTRRASP